MNIQRGEVFAARFPHATGTRGKKRPVLVVQADGHNHRLRHAVVAQFTTNLADRHDAACLMIEATSAEGLAAGIEVDSLVSCYLLSLMSEDRLTDKIGVLSDHTMLKIDECLKAALALS